MDFETHIKRTIGYWCNRLTQSVAFTMPDPAGEIRLVPSPYYPQKPDLESLVWVKIRDPKVWKTLQEIWNDSSSNGGYTGVDRYLSVIATNVSIDEHQRMQARPWDYGATSTDEEGNIVPLIDIITDESGEWIPFGLEDLKHILTSQEYDVLFDHFFHNGDYRTLADQYGLSKSDIGRIAKSAMQKAKNWIEQLKHGPKVNAIAHRLPVLVSTPYIRRNWRPDRIPPEVLENWFIEPLPVMPFMTCRHGDAAAIHQIEGAGARWAICETCHQNYWRSIRDQIESDLHEAYIARLETMLAELGTLGTEALGSREPEQIQPATNGERS